MAATATSIREGARVLIQGLDCTPQAEHNGRHGIVIGAFHSTSTGCWPVQVEGLSKLILHLHPANMSLAELQRKCEPRHFSHLVHAGSITLLGFGSLVSKSSASASFAFKHFRIGSITGYQRIFNRSDWINCNRRVMDKASGKYLLPARPWVYPAPGYLQSIYRAHVLAGLADSLLVCNQSHHLPTVFLYMTMRLCRTQHCSWTARLCCELI
jgi:hypothetical protein